MLNFLVRDWQNFEEEHDCGQMQREMEQYLDKVIAERDAKDLQETRQQIVACFDMITCYGLVHPGTAVTKKNFKGISSRLIQHFSICSITIAQRCLMSNRWLQRSLMDAS
jgi:atlastin